MENSVSNTAVSAIDLRLRESSPERRPSGCWSGIWFIGKRKSAKRIVPAPEFQDRSLGSATNAWVPNHAPMSMNSNQLTSLSLSLLAPPSSPASFANSNIPSSVQSPANFTLSSSLPLPNRNSLGEVSMDRTPTMFTIGPYAHETAIVTPPAFSAFTTAPSTAPFTPPEPNYFTMPASPDVSFAKLLTYSLREKGSIEHHSPTQSAHCDHVVDYDLNQHFSESPLYQLVLPACI